MAYPVSGSPYAGANPSPAYSGTFIPELWSGKLVEKFYDATVLAAIANTDYEGEITNQGDKVKIRTKPSLTISDYQIGQTLTIQRPASSIVELNIDKGKYFNAELNDIYRIQSDLNQLSMWADDASEQMKIAIDTQVLAGVYAKIAAANVGATAGRLTDINLGTTGAPISITNVNAIDYIILMGQVLDESNIPETGRWVVIPAWFATRIKLSELKDASLTGDGTSMLRNGRLGMIDRFTIYSSNLLPSPGGVTDVLAGHSHGLTFASQMTVMETLRSELTFGTLLRGLQVYGWDVTDGTALTGLRCTQGALV